MTKILCFGDSITFGYMPGGVGRFGAGERYAGLLPALLGTGCSVFEDGVCGRSVLCGGCNFTDGHGDTVRLTADVQDFAADIVVLQLGSNDCLNFCEKDADQIAGGMADLVLAASGVKPAIRAILCAPPALRRGTLCVWDGVCERSISVSAALPDAYKRTAAALGCGFVDGNAAGPADPADGLHLNADGHRRLAELLAAAVKNIEFAAL